MKSFLIGLGMGVGLGVLLAPMSGEETRSRLSESANDLADHARSKMEQGRDRVQRGVNRFRSAAGRAADTVSDRISETRPTGTESANF